jgi:hypothetical protein
MGTPPVSALDRASSTVDVTSQAFLGAVNSVLDGNTASNGTQPNSVVVVAATSGGVNAAGLANINLNSVRIAPDATAGLVSQTIVSDTAVSNASDASGGGTSAVVVTTDASGQQSQATVVTVTGNETGNGSTIAIDVPASDGSDTVTTVTIDSGLIDPDQLPDDARIAFGVLSRDATTGQPNTLILIVPTGTDSTGASTFNVATVRLSETLDPTAAFRNFGFSGSNGGVLTSSFGGAVALEVDGQQQIVWLSAGRNIPPSFTGEVEADFGTLDPSNSGAAGTVAGLVGKVTLVFENGQLVSQRDAEGEEIEDFDAWIRDQIAGQPELPTVDAALSATWQTAIVSSGTAYVIGNSNNSSSNARNIGENEQANLVNRLAITSQDALPRPAPKVIAPA